MDDDDEESVRKVEDFDDSKSDYSSFSNLMRRRNNADEDDGEDEEFQRIEDEEYDIQVDNVEVNDESDGEMVHACHEVDIETVMDMITQHDSSFDREQ
jgi:hypothetical protein